MRNRAYAWDINFTIKLAWSIESMCGDQTSCLVNHYQPAGHFWHLDKPPMPK